METTYSLLFIFLLFGLTNFFFLDDATALLENFSTFKIAVLSTVFMAFMIGYFITISAVYIGKKIDQLIKIIKESQKP